MKTHRVCCKCGNKVVKETVIKEYPFYCKTCDENLFSFETIKTSHLRSNKNEK